MVPLYRTKVAEDTTRKINDVTVGELLPFLTKRISNPIRKRKWEVKRQE